VSPTNGGARPANRMGHPTTSQRHLVLSGLLVALALVTSLGLAKNTDFRVYWYAARALSDYSGPLYGPYSGLGFPMHYRYPPVTYLLLWPFSRLPLEWAGFVWMMGEWAAMTAAVVLMVRTAKLQLTCIAILAACAYMLAYVVLAVRSGNVQSYLIALILSAMCLSESHRRAAGFLLAVAITFKIWPLFFLPWFLRRRRRILAHCGYDPAVACATRYLEPVSLSRSRATVVRLGGSKRND